MGLAKIQIVSLEWTGPTFPSPTLQYNVKPSITNSLRNGSNTRNTMSLLLSESVNIWDYDKVIAPFE